MNPQDDYLQLIQSKVSQLLSSKEHPDFNRLLKKSWYRKEKNLINRIIMKDYKQRVKL